MTMTVVGFKATKNGTERCTISRLATFCREAAQGRYSPKLWVGVCRTVLKTLTLFQTKIYDFS